MDLFCALRVAGDWLALHPGSLPAPEAGGVHTPETFKRAWKENLAFALCERSEALITEFGLDKMEADERAAREIEDLATRVPLPTLAHLAEARREIEANTAAEAEE